MKSSNRCANYFRSLGIKKGDKVMLVLKRHYQFWFAMLALHKIGAVAIPATYQLVAHDFTYRYQSADVSAIVCTADGDVGAQAELGRGRLRAAQGPRARRRQPRRLARAFDERIRALQQPVRTPQGRDCGRRHDAHVLYERHDGLPQDRFPQLQIRAWGTS